MRKLGKAQRRVRDGLPRTSEASRPVHPHRFGVFQYAIAKRVTGESYTDSMEDDPVTGSLKSAYSYEGEDE